MRFKRLIRAEAAPEIGNPYRGTDDLWRIDNVPICSTGIEYPLSSGKHTFTESELEDAVKAASGADVAINPPRLKLGHSSKANAYYLSEDEPAFGRVENLALSTNKQTVYGSFVGTPEWLAKVLPVAYPSRSVDARLDVETVTGKKYEMVITDVSLLGVSWPGCTVLEDLPLWYGSETPTEAEITASVDVSIIRRKFYNDGPGNVNQSWWIRGERFDTDDGYNLIVDEGDGSICRVPVGVDEDEVRFGAPVSVTEQYPDKAFAAQAVLAGMKMADPAMVIHASRAETDRPDKSTQEGEAMDEELRLSLANRLGLPENATEEQIRTELAKPVSAEDPPPGDGDGDDGEEGDGDEGTGEEAPADTPGVVAETITMDRDAYEELKKGAQLAASHEAERVSDRIKQTVEAAVMDGRIPPARREHWTKALKADFDGSKAVIDGLEKGLVPIGNRGVSGGDEEGISGGESSTGLPDDWFPEIAAIRSEASKPRRVINAKEG